MSAENLSNRTLPRNTLEKYFTATAPARRTVLRYQLCRGALYGRSFTLRPRIKFYTAHSVVPSRDVAFPKPGVRKGRPYKYRSGQDLTSLRPPFLSWHSDRFA